MAPTKERKSDGALASTSGEQKSFLSRFTLPRANRADKTATTDAGKGGARSAPPTRSQSRFGKLMFGWLILLLVVEFATTGLQLLDAKFKLGLLTPWFHTSAFLIGGLNWFYAINLLIVIATYYFLVRFNLIPRDLFGNFSSARSQTTAVSQPGRPSPDGMSKSRRTRAARRHTVVTPPSTHSTTRRSVAKTRVATPPSPPPAPTGNDDAYQQVKEAQRQLRRREAKR